MNENPERLRVTGRLSVFSTRWFEIIAKTLENAGICEEDPYYIVRPRDFVSVLAITTTGSVLLVKQFRPAVEAYTLELPSGHIEVGESPSLAARRELLEETGYVADETSLMGVLVPDAGRMENRMWCYFAENVSLDVRRKPSSEEKGIEALLYSQEQLLKAIIDGTVTHALTLATILLAVVQRKLSL